MTSGACGGGDLGDCAGDSASIAPIRLIGSLGSRQRVNSTGGASSSSAGSLLHSAAPSEFLKRPSDLLRAAFEQSVESDHSYSD